MIIIQEYSLKRGFSPDIERVKSVFVEHFDGLVPEVVDGRCISGFGAMRTISFWFEGKKLCVDTVSSDDAGDEVILDTNSRFRKFLEGATGYTAKQRRDKVKKQVSK